MHIVCQQCIAVLKIAATFNSPTKQCLAGAKISSAAHYCAETLRIEASFSDSNVPSHAPTVRAATNGLMDVQRHGCFPVEDKWCARGSLPERMAVDI